MSILANGLARLAAVVVAVALMAETPPPPVQIVDCAKHGYDSYTLVRGDTCQRLVAKPGLHFKSIAQIEQINRPLSGFACSKVRPGGIVCHPRKSSGRP